MKYPEISYKRSCTIGLSEIDDTMTMLTIKAIVPDVTVEGRPYIEVTFERSCKTRFLEDKRFLTHWVTGVICDMETHEARHWIKIDGVGLRDKP